MGKYIDDKLRKVRKIYNAMKILFYKIPRNNIKLRRKIFFASALPHFAWLFSTWFFFTDLQQRKINSTYSQGIRIVYNLYGWDTLSTQILSREKTLSDFIYSYWTRFSKHLETSLEATQYQHTWISYGIISTYNRAEYKKLDFRKNSIFLNRLVSRAKHSKSDWLKSEANHKPQYEIFRKSSTYINEFVYKYFLQPP